MTHHEKSARLATGPGTTLDELIKEIQRHALALLRHHNSGLTEYSLMHQLSAIGIVPFCDTPRRDPLQLFQQHFMLFHALYTLLSTLAPPTTPAYSLPGYTACRERRPHRGHTCAT